MQLRSCGFYSPSLALPLTFSVGSIRIGFLCSHRVTHTRACPLLYFLWSPSRRHSSPCPSVGTPVPSPVCCFEALHSPALAPGVELQSSFPASKQSEPFSFCRCHHYFLVPPQQTLCLCLLPASWASAIWAVPPDDPGKLARSCNVCRL